MRDIKCRAWDTVNKEWVNMISLFTDWHDTKYVGVATVTNNNVVLKSDETLIWEQYTGLKDKNGKEIYEGDIILNHNGYDHCDIKDIVIFENGKFTTHKKVANIKSYSESGTTYQVIVIGNIHENIELLEDR